MKQKKNQAQAILIAIGTARLACRRTRTVIEGANTLCYRTNSSYWLPCSTRNIERRCVFRL